MTDTLGDALPREMARVRDKVLPHYREIGPTGVFAVACICADLDIAAKGLAEGDIEVMIMAYQALKRYEA
jgi:hypothetical protein